MKTFIQFVNESRRNPSQNPKISAYEYLKPYANQDDIYITFTELQKVGIKPLSNFNTPNGVYVYPLKETWKEYQVEKLKSLKQYPFASDRPFITILQGKHTKSFIQDMIKDYTSKDYDRDKDKLLKMCIDREIMNNVERMAITTADSFHKNVVGYFWNMTRIISSLFRVEFNLSGSSDTQVWNNLLRRLGYTGFADKSAKSLIHPSEPLQAFFLTSSEYKIIDQIPNRDYTIQSLKYIVKQPKYINQVLSDGAVDIEGGLLSFKQDDHNLINDITHATIIDSRLLRNNITIYGGIYYSTISNSICDLNYFNYSNCEFINCQINDFSHYKSHNCKFKFCKTGSSPVYFSDCQIFSQIFNQYFKILNPITFEIFESLEKSSDNKQIFEEKLSYYFSNYTSLINLKLRNMVKIIDDRFSV